MWEDTIVEALDAHWRFKMAGCKSKAEWVGISRNAIETLIHKGKLPKSALPSKDKVKMRIEERSTTAAKQFLMTGDVDDYINGRILFVVDCQTLADITCGKTVISSTMYEPISQRIYNNICDILASGIQFQNQLSPIERRPRNFNQLADELANYSMDHCTNVEWSCDTLGSWRHKDIVFSDGGLRCRGGCASAAWIVLEKPSGFVGTCGSFGTALVLAKGAIFMPNGCSSSFMAEAIALEEATKLAKARMCGPNLPSAGNAINFETAVYRKVV